MTQEVKAAIEEIKATFPDHRVDVEDEPQGGAYVVVADLSIGKTYVPSTTWVGFLLSYQYPYADVYPHFIDGEVQRVDKQSLGGGFSNPRTWQNRLAIQVSRRSNHWNPALDTATTKLVKVLEWIGTR